MLRVVKCFFVFFSKKKTSLNFGFGEAVGGPGGFEKVWERLNRKTTRGVWVPLTPPISSPKKFVKKSS